MRKFRKAASLFLVTAVALAAFAGCGQTGGNSSGGQSAGGQSSGGQSGGSTYPEKGITLIIQSSPGGGSDLFARTFVNAVNNNQLLPEVMTPENMPGGSGAVAYAYVADKAGDPYYLLNASGTFITTPILGQGTEAAEVDYTQFTPIAALCLDEMAIAVPADSEFETLDDLIQAAIAEPDAVLGGGTEMGSPDSICYHLIEKETGAQINYIVFDGADEMNAGLLGHNIDVAIGNPGDFMELYKGGRIRLLGTFSEERLASLPDIPTLKEQGLDITYQLTRGFAAPKDIPQEAVEVLEKCIQDFMETDEWKQYVESYTLTEKYMDSEEFTQFLEESTAEHTEYLKEMGLIE